MKEKTRSSTRLGARIRAARLKSKMTQLALAHAIGYKGEDAGAYVSRVETGNQEPRLPVLARLAKALKVNLASLVQ